MLSWFFTLLSFENSNELRSIPTGDSRLENLPVELLLHVLSFFGPSELSNLKLAGSRHINAVMRHYIKPTFKEFCSDLLEHAPSGLQDVYNKSPRNRSTSFMPLAAGTGRFTLVDHLLSLKVPYDERVEQARIEVGLEFAAQYGQVEMVKYLITKGPDLLYRENDVHTALRPRRFLNNLRCCPMKALHFAVTDGNKEIVKILLDYHVISTLKNVKEIFGLELPYFSEYWMTALHVAAQEGMTDIAEMMIDHPVNIDINYHFRGRCGPDGCERCKEAELFDKTPFEIAVKYERKEFQEMLRRKGAIITTPATTVEATTEAVTDTTSGDASTILMMI